MSKEAMKLALEALKANQPVNYCMNNNGEKFPMFSDDPMKQERNGKAIKALEEALAKQEQVKSSCFRCNSPKKCAVHGCSPLTWPSEKQEQRSDNEHMGEPVALNLSQFRLVALQTDHPQDKKPMEWHEAFAQGWNGMIAALEKVGPLYTTPQQRKPLTDEQIIAIVREASQGSAIRRDGSTSLRIARAIEAAHGIKE